MRAATGQSDVWSDIADPRDHALRLLVDRLRADRPSVTVLEGPPGIGKSWLVDRALDAVTEARVLRTAFSPGLDVGTAPLFDLVPDLARRPAIDADPGQIAGLVISDLFDRHPEGGVLVVEDLHWATPNVIDAIAQLVEEIAAERQPFRVLATIHDRVDAEVDESMTGLRDAVAALCITVPPMGEAEVHQLVFDCEQARIDPALLDQLMGASRGNPLFVTAAVRELIDRGDAYLAGGRLSAPCDVVARMPAELSELLDVRLDRLDTLACRAVAAVAMLDVNATRSAVAALLGAQAEDDISDDLERAVDLGVVTFEADRMVVPHELIGRAALDRLTDQELCELHGAAAALLAGVGASPVVVARHLVDAASHGSVVVLGEHGPPGVEALLAVGAWGTAGRLGDLIESRRTATASVRLATGLAHFKNADQERALAAYEQAVERAVATGEVAIEVRARCWRSRAKAFTTRLQPSPSLVADLLRTARDPSVAEDPSLVSQLQCAAAEILASAGLIDDAIAASDEAVRAAGGDDALLAAAHSSSGITLLSTLDVTAARRHFDLARRHASAAGETHLVIVASTRAAYLELCLGELDVAETLSEENERLVARHGSWAERCLAAALRCSLALARGDLEDLSFQGERALRLLHRSDYYLGPLLVFPTLISGALAAGESSRAWELLDDWAATGQRGQGALRLLTRLREGASDHVADEFRRRPVARRWSVEPNFANVGLLSALLAVVSETGSTGDDFDRVMAVAERIASSELMLIPTAPSSGTMLWADSLRAVSDAETAAALYADAASLAATWRAPLVQAQALLRRAACLTPGETDRTRAAETAKTIADRLGADGIARQAAAILEQDGATAGRILDGSTPVAVVLTDVVDSTAIADRHGDTVYTDMIDHHDQVVRGEIRRFGGHHFDHTGDGLYAWFSRADTAVDCMRSIQRHFPATIGDVAVELRTAVVYGDCYYRRGKPYGSLNNLAARVCGLGAAGSIVVTADVLDELPASRRTARALPAKRLKGITDPPDLFDLIH